jgi:uncharacterized membrane protein (DUF2068 family)
VSETKPEGGSTSQRHRPFGVYAIIALQMAVIASNWADAFRVQLNLSPFALPDLHNDVLTTALTWGITALLLVVIVGLYRLQRWAWMATMILQGIALAYGIWTYFQGGQPYLSLLINMAIVFYLNQREVQESFGHGPRRGTG